MHFGIRQIAAVLSAAALVVFCSCEKHRVGEDPEIQKEHDGTENAAAANKAVDLPENSSPNRTPAEFFPKATPTP